MFLSSYFTILTDSKFRATFTYQYIYIKFREIKPEHFLPFLFINYFQYIKLSFEKKKKISGGDGEETKTQACSSTQPEAKHFESWPTLMYASLQGFHMFNANIFGLNMIKGL